MKVLLLLLGLNLVFSSDPIFTYGGKQVQLLVSLSEVDDSGDQYPTVLPKVVDDQAFKGLKALFILANGVEDHEVYYQHQYLTDRGVSSVTFGCQNENPTLIIEDFFKPSYSIQCIKSFNLNDYDIIIIPGGLPSSGMLRANQQLIQDIFSFWNNPLNKDKIIAPICSGTETLISSGIIDHLQETTGSPASTWSFNVYYDSVKKSRDLFKGNDAKYDSIAYPSDGQHAHLVIGKNPNGSPSYVVNIGNTLKNLSEVIPDQNDPSTGVKLNLNENKKYVHKDFNILPGDTYLKSLYPVENHKWVSSKRLLDTGIINKLNGAQIVIAMSSGADYDEFINLMNILRFANPQITIACPSWVFQYKNKNIFLHSNTPSAPKGLIKCEAGFDTLGDTFKVLIVPGGMFSTNGVLRNDQDLLKFSSKVQTIALSGSGIDLLLPFQIHKSKEVPQVDTINEDLKLTNTLGSQKLLSYPGTPNLVLSNGEDMYAFVEEIAKYL